MSARVLLISDLHLEEQRRDITDAFVNFLQENRGKCSALYVLGDLFEVWIGDDVKSPLAALIAESLREFSEGGSAVHLMHGNRDFLLGTDFAAKCSASLIQDPHLFEEQGLQVLLLHGDSLCTDDVDYQQFRTMVRDPQWQSTFLGKSIEERISYAEEARKQSQAATDKKSMAIMDVNPTAVEALFHSSGQRFIIHGHTHRPAIHEVALEKNITEEIMGKRIVLGDWDKAIWFAEIKNGEIDLHSLPIA